MMNVTELEAKTIDAIDKSEYGEFLTDPVWTKYIADDAGIPRRSFSGVVSSLVKKGLVSVYDHDPNEGCIQLTDEGCEVAASLAESSRIPSLRKRKE